MPAMNVSDESVQECITSVRRYYDRLDTFSQQASLLFDCKIAMMQSSIIQYQNEIQKRQAGLQTTRGKIAATNAEINAELSKRGKNPGPDQAIISSLQAKIVRLQKQEQTLIRNMGILNCHIQKTNGRIQRLMNLAPAFKGIMTNHDYDDERIAGRVRNIILQYDKGMTSMNNGMHRPEISSFNRYGDPISSQHIEPKPTDMRYHRFKTYRGRNDEGYTNPESYNASMKCFGDQGSACEKIQGDCVLCSTGNALRLLGYDVDESYMISCSMCSLQNFGKPGSMSDYLSDEDEDINDNGATCVYDIPEICKRATNGKESMGVLQTRDLDDAANLAHNGHSVIITVDPKYYTGGGHGNHAILITDFVNDSNGDRVGYMVVDSNVHGGGPIFVDKTQLNKAWNARRTNRNLFNAFDNSPVLYSMNKRKI